MEWNTRPTPPADTRQPLTLRLKLSVGKVLGFFFVPENHVQAIYREGLYWDARGPGIARYDWWAESLGPLVYTSGQFGEYTLKNMFTRDIVPVSIRIQAIVAYNPTGTKREIARILTTLPRQTLKNVAEPYLRWAMMEQVNRCDATQVTQHDVLAQIADGLAPTVTNEMRFLGLSIAAKIKILEVQLPQTLGERQEMIAQRRATMAANVGVDPTDMRRALVTEVLERMGRDGIGDSLISFSEFLDSYAAAKAGRPPPQPPTIDVTPRTLNSSTTPAVPSSIPTGEPIKRQPRHH
ncbi:MAG: hypothetical protein HY782_05650 [Chloroflexi bacterium]|nr:hypothetical protein [Chloroflexota bacterium]